MFIPKILQYFNIIIKVKDKFWLTTVGILPLTINYYYNVIVIQFYF